MNAIKPKKPAVYKYIKIIGFSLLAIGIISFIISFFVNVPNAGDEDWIRLKNLNAILKVIGFSSVAFSIVIIVAGYRPEIARINIQTTNYVIKENKEIIKDTLDTAVEIAKESIKEDIKEDIKEEIMAEIKSLEKDTKIKKGKNKKTNTVQKSNAVKTKTKNATKVNKKNTTKNNTK